MILYRPIIIFLPFTTCGTNYTTLYDPIITPKAMANQFA